MSGRSVALNTANAFSAWRIASQSAAISPLSLIFRNSSTVPEVLASATFGSFWAIFSRRATVIESASIPSFVSLAERITLTVASLKTMWVELELRPEDAARVTVGRPMTFRPDADAEGSVTGKVTFVASELDGRTRTVKVRAEVDNDDRRLRAGSFGRGAVAVRDTEDAVVVPSASVHWEGCCHVVFVEKRDLLFETRKVIPGITEGRLTEIRAGLLPGEVIATTGSFLLKSEILKSRLGASCKDD